MNPILRDACIHPPYYGWMDGAGAIFCHPHCAKKKKKKKNSNPLLGAGVNRVSVRRTSLAIPGVMELGVILLHLFQGVDTMLVTIDFTR